MKRTLVIFAVVFAMLAVCLPVVAFAADTDPVLTGVVSGDAGPLASASVKVEYLAKGGLPRKTATLTTGVDGSWSYFGKAGDYRLTFSAAGYYDRVEVVYAEAKTTTIVNVQLSPVPPPVGTITGRITTADGNGLSGFVYFYKQNADGSWPTGYIRQVATAYDGTYTSGDLPLGVYKVRLFTVHTGVQWYRYVSTMEAATPLSLVTAGDVITGINAIYPPPAP